jgi:hypothetical protein
MHEKRAVMLVKNPRRVHPNLIELGAFAFLDRMRRLHGGGTTLGTVPASVWEGLASEGFALVWLMGVWERSPGSRERALADPGLRQAYDGALPGWTGDDVLGSPYAVFSYRVDPRLGTEEDLLLLRKTLNSLGMGLILDFVPNHLAVDHPWTGSHPEWFIQGSAADLDKEPGLFFRTEGGAVIAHGKDPYFPAWTDTAQLDYSSPGARSAVVGELRRIAGLCDGVRCDMAMLLLKDVFRKTWAGRIQESPGQDPEFWADAIRDIKRENRLFLFIAESYWDLEYRLQLLGFDFTYDKKLYDLMLNASAREVMGHLSGDDHFQRRCVRFIENHDELRAVSSFGRERSLAAVVIAATTPGLHLFHEGQLEGRSTHLPVQLGRSREEQPDPEVRDFYQRLFSFASVPPVGTGAWKPLDVKQAGEGNYSHENLLAWIWHDDESLKIVCVNFSGLTCQGRLRISPGIIQAGPLTFRDVATGEIYVRTTDEVLGGGLYVELPPWKAHLLDLLS